MEQLAACLANVTVGEFSQDGFERSLNCGATVTYRIFQASRQLQDGESKAV
jgi:hypothetical protein